MEIDNDGGTSGDDGNDGDTPVDDGNDGDTLRVSDIFELQAVQAGVDTASGGELGV